jgi:alpha-tubulin suppressor-like RCC1 family protein
MSRYKAGIMKPGFNPLGTQQVGYYNALYGWGYNANNELGLGDTANRLSPTQVGPLTDWKSISAGVAHILAIKYDGSLWTWGNDNPYGQSGLNSPGQRSLPTQVGALTNWSSISAGNNHTAAIKTDGTLWAWGLNYQGQLGLGDAGNYTDRSSPVQVGSGTTWASVSGGYLHTAAIKTDGSLWTWGYNPYGQLGKNDLVSRSSPVQVGALTNWSSVSAGYNFVLAIKTDGTLWSWGYNIYGRLGLNDIVDRSSPVQVGSGTTWSKVSVGFYHTAAIKTDGTLWAWGLNTSGQLGQNDLVSRSSPVQVGALTNWSSVSGGSYLVTAIKTDGTLWTWGLNSYGQLGQNDLVSRSSPTQVGLSTSWTTLNSSNGAPTGASMFALQ